VGFASKRVKVALDSDSWSQLILKDSEINRTAKLKPARSDNNSLDDEIIDLLSDCDGPKTCRLLSLLSTLTEKEEQNSSKSEA
jgi:hypothetical protein